MQSESLLLVSTMHTQNQFLNIWLLKVIDILKLQELKFYYKFKHNKLPIYLQSLHFHHNFEIHEQYTNTHHQIQIGKPVHKYAKKCIRFHLPISINSTSKVILSKIDSHNLKDFAGYIKQYYLNSYEDICTIPCVIFAAETK